MKSNNKPNNLERTRHDFLFGVRRSIRYHHRRRRFFDLFHQISTFLAALAGTATFATVLGKAPTNISLVCAFFVTVFAVADLVVGSAREGRLHDDLAKRFIDLEKEMIGAKELQKESIADFTAKRLDIEKDEPPPLKVLDSICHNELLRAMDYDQKYFVQIKWYQRLFAQIFDIREHAVQRKPAQEKL